MQGIIEKQRQFFRSDKTKSLKFRLLQLNKLKESLLKNYNDLVDAFKKDYNKCEFDMVSTEFSLVLKELNYMLKNLKRFAKPQKVKISLLNLGAKGYRIYEPYGVVLIVAPWNYPLQLALLPLVDSIATGNTTVLKLSENTPNIANVIKKILNIFDEDYIYVTTPEDRDELFLQKYDFCFFTGSTSVGKILLSEQSKFLTPCVLELGGKSPCIIDQDADLEISAKRLVWGKYLNAGQTCVAPDFVLVHKNKKEDLLKKVDFYIKKYYFQNGTLSENFTYVITNNQVEKLYSLIKDEHIVFGGKFEGRRFEPTVVDGINFSSKIMKEEIFGPIMPIIEFEDIDEIIKTLKLKEKPLALYYFGKKNQEKVLNSLSFGGGCINDTIMHLTEENLPFGGVGFSGMGCYHGKKSFETFSHQKSVLKKSKSDIDVKYPPYNEKKLRLIKWLFKIK